MEVENPKPAGSPTNHQLPPFPSSPPSSSADNNNTILLIANPNADPSETEHVIDKLRNSDDSNERVLAAYRLADVARVIGTQRTREELVPFITESVDDEDEVLLALASLIDKLMEENLLGGVEYTHLLLEPLELLLMSEEASVRDVSIQSMKAVVEKLTDQEVNCIYKKLVLRMADKEWFTARMSACSLIWIPFVRFEKEVQDQVMQLYANLCRDEAPMVRRVAAQHLGNLFQVVVESRALGALANEVMTIILPLYKDLWANDQDSVRLHMVENCIIFGRHCIPLDAPEDINVKKMVEDHILPILIDSAEDRSWRVRWTAASKFADIINVFQDLDDDGTVVTRLVCAFEKLLANSEAEVRTAATFNISAVSRCEKKVPSLDTEKAPMSTATGELEKKCTVARRLMKRVQALTDDDNEHVRTALATVATELAPLLGRDDTITHLLPPLLVLLRDSHSEVRLNIISTLSSLNEVIGVNLLSQALLPAILELAEDSKWRVRMAIISHIPMLVKQLGKEFVSEKISPLCIRLLADDVASIRQAAAINLKNLALEFGSEWLSIHILPTLKDMKLHQSYLRRIIVIKACAAMGQSVDSSYLTSALLPILLEMASDTVPNVRFNVCKVLPEFLSNCDELDKKEIISTVVPVIQGLVDDPDRDVQYYSNITLEELSKIS